MSLLVGLFVRWSHGLKFVDLERPLGHARWDSSHRKFDLDYLQKQLHRFRELFYVWLKDR